MLDALMILRFLDRAAPRVPHLHRFLHSNASVEVPETFRLSVSKTRLLTWG